MIVGEFEKNDIAVSVIVPAYNAEETLSAAIDSLLAQTLQNIEIIIVNDGSTDATADIIKKYELENPGKIIGIHKENAGVSVARNAGLEIARGEYVGFCDADDKTVPDMFLQMYQYALEKEADMVQCWRYDVSPEKEVIRKPKKHCTGSSIYDNPKIISSQTLFVWDKIFRNKIIQEHNVRFKYRYAEDFYFIMQFELYAQNIEELQLPLYCYMVQRMGAVTSCLNSSMLDIPKALSAANDLILDAGYYNNFVGQLWKVEAHYYLRCLNRFWSSDDKKLQEELAKAYFDLFNHYFYNWESSILYVGSSKKIEYRFNAYRSNWDKMLKFINYPKLFKRACRKPVFLIIQLLKWKDKKIKKIRRLKSKFDKKIEKIRRLKSKFNKRKPAMQYAKYCQQPVQEKVVLLTSYFGSSFSDSMYYLALDLLQRGDYKVYVGSNSLKRESVFVKYNKIEPIIVDVNSDEYLKILATAKYVICNSRFPTLFAKRDEQIYLNTWHGTPLKKLGKDMNSGLKDVGNNQGNFLMCDYLLYPNEYTQNAIMNSFFLNKLYSGKVILSGYPRNAAFFDQEDAKRLREKLDLLDKRVFIYMPTWRGSTLDSANIKNYANELNDLLERLDELLDDDVVVFIKLHQVVMRKIKLKHFRHLRLPHPLYENYRFVNMADGLITDYSSVFFDFANTKKEIILFTYDYEDYMSERGMYFDMDSLPFRRINDVDELAAYLNSKRNFVPDVDYWEFCQKYCKYDDKETPKYINDVILGEKTSDKIKLISYKQNATRKYHIHFMSNLKSVEQQLEFEEMVCNAGTDDLFVFAQWSFARATEELLVKYANSGIQYVVTPGEMPATFLETLALYLYRKFGICKNNAKKMYTKELKRILPGINIEQMTNHSNDPKFSDICNVFNVSEKK